MSMDTVDYRETRMGLRPLRSSWRASRVALLLADCVLLSLSMFLAFWLRFDGTIPTQYLKVLALSFPIVVGVKVPFMVLLGLYRFSWRHVGVRELVSLIIASGVGSAGLAAVVFLMQETLGLVGFPRSVLAIDFAFSLLLVGAVRLSGRLLLLRLGRTHEAGRRVLVVGAGGAGAQLVRALQDEQSAVYTVVGFVDDEQTRGVRIHGVRVLGSRAQLPRLIASREVSTILVAMPSASAQIIRETIALARQGGVEDIKIVPSLSELYTGRIELETLREVRPEDLIKRDPVRVEVKILEAFLKGRTVLVTGAAGSIGSEICRQVLRFGAGRLVAVDFNETGLFHIEQDLSWRFPNQVANIEVADVRDKVRVAAVFEAVSPHVVYHAAAYKHVPMMEAFPCEAVKANVQGTRNVLEEACRSACDAFVLISTDKAVNPTSVMGTTKRVAELLVRSCADQPVTRCVAVRFGNVLGSRGSVLGTFKEQIEQRRPVTVTHPDMRRYFMVTSEAVQLVLQASATGRGGEVLVLDMGEPMKIVDLAENLIRFYGLEPNRDIPIVYTGLRPGEKLFEELLTAEEGTDSTSHERLFVARMEEPVAGWEDGLARLTEAADEGNTERVLEMLKMLVPRYCPERRVDEG